MNTIIQYITQSAPIFTFVGVYFLILSYQKRHEIEHTIQKGKMTQGTVTEIRENENLGFAPVVQFETINGVYTHYSSSFRFSCKYFVGQKVKIFYYIYRSRRQFALEDDTPGSLPDKLKILGIVLCLIGAPVLFLKFSNLF